MPIILALILNELRYPRFKKVSQTILYLPHFLSWAIIGSVAMTMFRPNSGLVNILLTNMGMISEGIPFLNEKWHWAITYLLIGVWQTMGWGTILYLAAITGINGELYEAAMIDGCNSWQVLWHVVMPVTDVQHAAKALKQRVRLACICEPDGKFADLFFRAVAKRGAQRFADKL